MLRSFITFIALIILALAICIGCSSSKDSNGIPRGDFDQQLFETPEELVSALKHAVNSQDSSALLKILGPDGRKLIFSGDAVSDKIEIAAFSRKLAQRAELIPYISSNYDRVSVMKLRIGQMGLNAGIPLVNEGKGWRLASYSFAPRSVKRRMATNEIEIWRACLEYVEAQREYIQHDRNGDGVLEYSKLFFSTPGKRDGLYWKTNPGEPNSPLGEVIAQATAQGYTPGSPRDPKPFHGYIFKPLYRQGQAARGGKRDYVVDGRMTKGFALIAYPVEWSASGVRTFMVNTEGIIYGKNLGVSTETLVDQIEEFNPDHSWAWVQNPQVNEYEEYLETLSPQERANLE